METYLYQNCFSIDTNSVDWGVYMRQFDDQEKKILVELIRDPRISDNQIGANTGIPIKTVNRKRKKLEEDRILSYYTNVDHSKFGSDQMPARQLFVVELKNGITRENFVDSLGNRIVTKKVLLKHIFASFLGERDGHVVLTFILESRQREDLIEIYNADVASEIISTFGQDAIRNTTVIDVTHDVRLFHNYLPQINMFHGKIKKELDKNDIFVEL